MKITIENGSDFDSILIVREGGLAYCHIRYKGDTWAEECPMPKGNGTLEINING